MADKLVVLTVLLVFSSFGPIFSDEVSDHQAGQENDLSPAFEPGSYFQNVVENSVSVKDQSIKQTQYNEDIEEDQAADRNSEDNSEDKASSSETAESKPSLGFFSQMFSDLAAPLYEEDEQDFLSEDREPEDPSVEDETGDDDQVDAIYVTSSGEDDKPKFASSRFEKSVTENVNSARTAEEEINSGGATKSDTDQAKGEDQPLPNASKEGNVSGSLPHSLPHSFAANAENKDPELPGTHTGEPDVGIDSQLEEGSIDLDRLQAELDSAANTKNESSLEQTDNKEINSQEEEEQIKNNRGQFEQDSTVNSVNAEDLNTETSVKEEPAEKEAEIDSAGVIRGRQDPEQEPRSADSSEVMQFDNKQPEDGATELSDEDLEHLRVKTKPSQVEVPSSALEEEEQDLRKNNKEEAELQEMKERMEEQERKLRLEKEERDAREKKKALEEQSRNLRLEETGDAEKKKKAMEEQTRKLMLEKEKRIAEDKKKAVEEQSRKLRLEKERRDKEENKKAMEEQTRKLVLEKEKRIAEDKKKALEEQSRNLRLEKEKRDEEEKKVMEEQTRKLMLEEEKRIAEKKKKKAMEEHARKVRLEKEKKAAEEEKQRKEEEARKLRLESLKKQRQQIEETEKMDLERLHREEKEDISLKKLSGAERKEEEVDDKVPEDEGIDQEKVNPTQVKGKTSEDNEDEEHIKIKGAFDQKMAEEEAELKRRLEMLSEERRNFEKTAEGYRVNKKERQQKEQKAKMSTKHSAESELRKAATAVSPASKQVKTSHHQAATQTLNTSATTTTAPAVNEELVTKEANTETSEATLVKSLQGIPTKVKKPVGSRTKRATATVTATKTTAVKEEGSSSVDVKPGEATGMQKEHVDERKEDNIPSDKPTCIEGFCQAKPNVKSLASRFQKVEDSLTSKEVLEETQFNNIKEKNSSHVNKTLSGYANFMRAFRSFHEKSVLFVFSYWPVAKNTTRNLLSYVGLDGMFDQLCNDLADVHPAVLFITFLFGTLGFLYFFWSLTFGRMRHGARGPNPRDVMRSYEARVRILEEELKSVEEDKLKSDMERNTAYNERQIADEQLSNANEEVLNLRKKMEKLQKEKQDVEMLVKEMKDNCQKLTSESKEKSEEIAGCEKMVLDLRATVEAKESEIQKLNGDFQKQQVEKELIEKHIEQLDEKIQQADVEKEKLEHLLTEAKEKKENLQVEFDDQLLRLTELQQQYEFKCNEVGVLKDCLKQIKLHGDGEEEPDEDEMAGRLQKLMNVDEMKTENNGLQEKVAALETEAEELRRIRKMLENDNVEKTERLEQAESKASQAMLTQREKEIELEALQKYFKSTEVELHRKITAEESSRISIENQLQSEQAKASTAVVDADKYRQLYLDIKKQIEEIDESKKEQLSNMEKKAHQNWLDYRAAARELDGLKDENEILRRKLYDLEVRGSRPGSSASSQLNHVDGRDSPSRRSPMSGLPGHGSPVPFNAPPMMGPPPPPPPSMFPGQRRPHPAEMLGMTPPRPPFPSPGSASRGHATPPPINNAVTAQSSKMDDRPDSFVQDSTDGVPPLPPPMSGYGPPPLRPLMRMSMFPPRPMMPPPLSGPVPRMFLPRPGGPMPPPPQGPRPHASSTPNRS